jgi:ribosomal protein S10
MAQPQQHPEEAQLMTEETLEAAAQEMNNFVAGIEKKEKELQDEKLAASGDDSVDNVLMELLQKASTEGVDVRGPLANQFNRDPSGAKDEEYKKCNRWEKQEFRKRWAAQKLDDMTKIREREDEWRQVDTSKGNMISIKALIKQEGPKDSKKYIEKCAKLGSPWIEWDPMWERYEVMVMHRSHADVFTKAWRLKCQRTEGPAVMTAGAAKDPPAKAVTTAPPKAPSAKAQAAKGSKRANPEGGESKTPAKKQATPTPLALANTTKKSFKSATSGVQTLTSVITTNPAWQWASNEHTLKPLQAARSALDQAVADCPFAQIFLTMPVSDVKKSYNDEQISKECGAMSALLDPLVRMLTEETSQLVNMHASRSKIAQ